MIFCLLYSIALLSTLSLACDQHISFPSIEQLTLEEKIGQMLMVSFHGASCNQNAQALITQAHVGGIIYYRFANELSSPEQVRNLSTQLQHVAQSHHPHIPLIIAVDQEGGRVNRLTAQNSFTTFPAQATLGSVNDISITEQAAHAIGQQLRAIGISMNMAPVADIHSNPQNPVIGDRSFGNDTELVIRHVLAALRGYERSRVISSLKHFSGHGDTDTDSHTTLPIIRTPQEQLWKRELAPFIAARHAPTIMTAHILVPAFDTTSCVTFSPIILTNILRKQIGYTGVIVSDSLLMHGALQTTHLTTAAIRAIQAGCDMILLGGRLLTDNTHHEITAQEITTVYNGILQAVTRGDINITRINESVTRILSLKKQYNVGYIPPLTNVQLHAHSHGATLQVLTKNIMERYNKNYAEQAQVMQQ